MVRYLIVAHLTAESPELRRHVENIVQQDASAEFTLLTPATPASYWRAWDEMEAHADAERRATGARASLGAAGANVTRTSIGAREPLAAIEDELREHADYNEIIICTFPAGVSRWLKLDLVTQCRRHHPGLPVRHVIAETAAEPGAARLATPTMAATSRHRDGGDGPRDAPAPAGGLPFESRPGPSVIGGGVPAATTNEAALGSAAFLTESDIGSLPFPDVRRGDLPEAFREFWDQLDERNGVANIFRTLGHNPHLLHAYVQMLSAIWQHCGIEPQLRELVVLRLAQIRRGQYLWHEHVRIARSLNIPDAKVAALEHWQSSEHVRFTERERTVLRYVDARCHDINTPAAEELLRELTLSALVGLNLLLGFYEMSDAIAQTMRIEPEEPFVGWALY